MHANQHHLHPCPLLELIGGRTASAIAHVETTTSWCSLNYQLGMISSKEGVISIHSSF